MIVEVECPEIGKVKQAGIPVKLWETPGQMRRLPPRRCRRIDEVLQGPGYTVADIDRL